MIVDREQLAWAAGFFDGEGCITLSHRGSRYMGLSLSIGQKLVGPELIWGESESLVKFQEAVQIGNIGKIYPDYRNGSSLYCQYRVSGYEQIQAIVAMLWPWLGEIKRNKWIECRKLYLENRNVQGISYPQRKRIKT